jgi:hypothetical protein
MSVLDDSAGRECLGPVEQGQREWLVWAILTGIRGRLFLAGSGPDAFE